MVVAAAANPPPDIPLARLGTAISAACTAAGLRPATTRSYLYWARRFVMHHGRRHPAELPPRAVAEFIGHLAAERGSAAATQNLVRRALAHLYAEVLRRPLPAELLQGLHARRAERLPELPERGLIAGFLDCCQGQARIAALLQYGCGLRLRSVVALRVADVDLAAGELAVDGARIALPRALLRELAAQVARRRQEGGADAELPLLAGSRRPRGQARRPALAARQILRAYEEARRAAGIAVRITATTLRTCFGLHLIEAGVHPRVVQERLGLRRFAAVEALVRLSTRGPAACTSPLDSLPAAVGG